MKSIISWLEIDTLNPFYKNGMNLLVKEDAWDNLMRIKSHQVAAELLEIACGEKDGFYEK